VCEVYGAGRRLITRPMLTGSSEITPSPTPALHSDVCLVSAAAEPVSPLDQPTYAVAIAAMVEHDLIGAGNDHGSIDPLRAEFRFPHTPPYCNSHPENVIYLPHARPKNIVRTSRSTERHGR
jgi:hypothetical protein